VSWSSSSTARSAPDAEQGAKSDAIDAERAARDALSWARLAQPKTVLRERSADPVGFQKSA
jgi:hypothetical protein